MTCFLTHSKYLYYEQFQVEVELFTIANALLMIFISAMSLRLILVNTDIYCDLSFSEMRFGLFLVFGFAIPHFLLSTTRLIKLIVQYLNPGQTICMINHLNLDKPPLGTRITKSYMLFVLLDTYSTGQPNIFQKVLGRKLIERY